MRYKDFVWASITLLLFPVIGDAQKQPLEAMDVFKLSYVSDPVFSPEGKEVVFVKHNFDVMTDKRTDDLWICNLDGSGLRPLAATDANESGPAWSPSGARLAWVASEKDKHRLVVRYMDRDEQAQLAEFDKAPGNLTWSPDGRWLAYTLFVPEEKPELFQMPKKPEGAEWSEEAIFTEELVYRADGRGQLPVGTTRLFLMPANGGSGLYLPTGEFDVSGPLAWSPDSRHIYYSSKSKAEHKSDWNESELYRIQIDGESPERLTEKAGPDRSPRISPDGRMIAWLGYENNYMAHQQTEIYLSELGMEDRAIVLTGEFDRTLSRLEWSPEGDYLWFRYDDEGEARIGRVSLVGKVEDISGGLSGNPVGRPYTSGDYGVGRNGDFAFGMGSAEMPPELAFGKAGTDAVRQASHFHRALLLRKSPGRSETFWVKSSHDSKDIQCWLIYPPGFNPNNKYPLLLEIHGGPHLAYGDCFSMELQQFAARGYVVLYTNPRGSTSYGEAFSNLIHHNYPGNDYDDLMSAVDAVVERGFIDEDRLYVTGGSGGGILTAWIVGKTDRFRAAVSAKPVINWVSEMLSSDIPITARYWFGEMPWENITAYWERSPLSFADRVSTPTMLLVGDLDYRTPVSESEQFYRALKLQGVETALIRFPDSPHGIAGRPSRMIAKARAIMGWFERYGGPME